MLEQVKDVIDSFVPVVRSSTARGRAQRFLDEGLVVHPTLGEVPYDDGGCWSRDVPRSLGRYLHGFLFLADWHESLLPESEAAVSAAAGAMLSWARLNRAPPGSSDMAFHDETTAQRLLQICHFVDGHAHRVPEDVVDELSRAAGATAELLLEPAFYAGRNNHGMFQDLALLRYAVAGQSLRGPAGPDLLRSCVDTALDRLFRNLTESFTADGVHVENSPGYHLMVCRYLRDLLPVFEAADLAKAEVLGEIYRAAERFATHNLLPDGRLPPLGDTKVERVRDTGHRTTFPGREYLYAVTQGARGTAPTERAAVYPEAGYAFWRSAWGDPDAEHVLFKAAYRSNYHHHADDLSLLVHTAGRLVLTEAGPYGYDYGDPLTQYAFSQYAHSTVVVDGVSQPRADPEPGGVSLRDLGPGDGADLDVEGTNARTPGTVHRRRIRVSGADASTSVEVRDRVEHDDGAVHSYEVLWHLGAGVRHVLHGHGAELYAGGRKVLELTWNAPVPVTARVVTPTGRTHPRAHRFPAFGQAEDGAVLVVSAEGRELELSTTVRTGDFLYRDWGVGAVGSPWSRAQEEVPLSYLLERTEGAEHLVVAFTAMAPPGSFTYNYRTTLETVNAHRMYVLDDFGDQGAYYYCDHRDLRIYRSVQRLLARTMAQLGVDPADVAFVGSSKGATAALVHGSSLGVGRIVVGAPQVLIGSFLERPHPNVLEFMAGGTAAEDVAWLDRIVANHVRRIRPETSIELLIGTKDHHYRDHLPHLVAELGRAGHDNIVIEELEGLTHADIGRPFAEFLGNRLRTAMGRSESSVPVLGVRAEAAGTSVRIVVEGVAATDYCAFYLYKGQHVVQKTGYARGRSRTSFDGLDAGAYRARVFRKTTRTSTPAAVSSRPVTVRG